MEYYNGAVGIWCLYDPKEWETGLTVQLHWNPLFSDSKKLVLYPNLEKSHEISLQLHGILQNRMESYETSRSVVIYGRKKTGNVGLTIQHLKQKTQ